MIYDDLPQGNHDYIITIYRPRMGSSQFCLHPMAPVGKLQETVGFRHVDSHVTRVMITWIGDVMVQTCKQFLTQMSEHFQIHRNCYGLDYNPLT